MIEPAPPPPRSEHHRYDMPGERIRILLNPELPEERVRSMMRAVLARLRLGRPQASHITWVEVLDVAGRLTSEDRENLMTALRWNLQRPSQVLVGDRGGLLDLGFILEDQLTEEDLVQMIRCFGHAELDERGLLDCFIRHPGATQSMWERLAAEVKNNRDELYWVAKHAPRLSEPIFTLLLHSPHIYRFSALVSRTSPDQLRTYMRTLVEAGMVDDICRLLSQVLTSREHKLVGAELTPLLTHEDPAVRRRVLEALGQTPPHSRARASR